MAQQSNEAPRRGAAIAVAAAGLTLAAGVTIGALVGWIRPPVAPAPTIEATTSAAVEEAAPPPPARPATPEPTRAVDLAAEPLIEPEPEIVAMERPRRHHHDDHERREHGEARERRSHEGDDDDD